MGMLDTYSFAHIHASTLQSAISAVCRFHLVKSDREEEESVCFIGGGEGQHPLERERTQADIRMIAYLFAAMVRFIADILMGSA
jgi:hypothetical protein